MDLNVNMGMGNALELEIYPFSRHDEYFDNTININEYSHILKSVFVIRSAGGILKVECL